MLVIWKRHQNDVLKDSNEFHVFIFNDLKDFHYNLIWCFKKLYLQIQDLFFYTIVVIVKLQ
jgi:hypothetical protein